MTRTALPAVLLLVVGASVAGCTNGGGEEPELLPRVDLEIPQVNVELGEPITARVVVLHPKEETPVPLFEPTDYGLTLIDSKHTGPEPLPGSFARSIFLYRLAGYVPGPVEIGPVQVRLPEREEPLRSQKIAVTIVDPIKPGTTIDLSSLRPEKGPVPVPSIYGRRLVLYLASGTIAAITAIVLVMWLSLKRRNKPEALEPTPKDRALSRLADLAERVPAENDLQPIYYDVNLTLRRYIEECFDILAAHQTTQEFLAAAGGRLPTPLQAGLEGYLAHCDMIKYARVPAGRDEAARTIERARQFVINAWQYVRHRFNGRSAPTETSNDAVNAPRETSSVRND